MKPIVRNASVIFAYLFFFLFIFTSLVLLVSDFSSTFSRLFAIFVQAGSTYDLFSRYLYFFGFCVALTALIVSSWNQSVFFFMRIVLLAFAIFFVFILVLDIFNSHHATSLIDFILTKQRIFSFKEIFALYFGEILIVSVFYLCFVFFPLFCILFNLRPNPNNPYGFFLQLARPSINVVIYTLMGCALQSYFHKDYLWCYVDLVALGFGLIMFMLVFMQRHELFRSYERINFGLLLVGIVVFASSSDLIQKGAFAARYSFFLCAFVAWCAEWMFAYASKKEK